MLLIEILPNLWIGNNESVKYKDKIGVTRIINCSKDLKSIGQYNEYQSQIGNNLQKYEIVKIYQYIKESIEFIHKNLLNDNVILVFCENGNQKSALVIASYIIKYGKLKKKDVIFSLRTKHNTAFYPTIDYNVILDMIESDI